MRKKNEGKDFIKIIRNDFHLEDKFLLYILLECKQIL